MIRHSYGTRFKDHPTKKYYESLDANKFVKRLENLNANEYVVAFGPEGKQFCATPSGYAASFLPTSIRYDLSESNVKKILWATFGSIPDSWFFVYELEDGKVTFDTGQAVPSELRNFTNVRCPRLLRVQLGDRDAFVAWTEKKWVCYDIPNTLQLKLRQLSSAVQTKGRVLEGSYLSDAIENVQWHANGSFYLKKGDQHVWHYETSMLSSAWEQLWQGAEGAQRDLKIRNELAYVAIDPHASGGNTFAFFKKHELGEEVPFILHFGHEYIHTNLPLIEEPTQPKDGQVALEKVDGPQPYDHWAFSMKSGRPHPADSWELNLQKGERVQILHDIGRDWFVVLGKQKIKGWAHRSWLDFSDHKPHAKPQNAYAKFQEDLQRLLLPGKLSRFFCMKSYIDICTMDSCQALKDDTSSLGICSHDLKLLLEGSGNWSYKWLKEGRNMWHPDRFARFCHVEHLQQLKHLAEQMFVLYSTLMDKC